jgi:hypothetical protein
MATIILSNDICVSLGSHSVGRKMLNRWKALAKYQRFDWHLIWILECICCCLRQRTDTERRAALSGGHYVIERKTEKQSWSGILNGSAAGRVPAMSHPWEFSLNYLPVAGHRCNRLTWANRFHGWRPDQPQIPPEGASSRTR